MSTNADIDIKTFGVIKELNANSSGWPLTVNSRFSLPTKPMSDGSVESVKVKESSTSVLSPLGGFTFA